MTWLGSRSGQCRCLAADRGTHLRGRRTRCCPRRDPASGRETRRVSSSPVQPDLAFPRAIAAVVLRPSRIVRRGRSRRSFHSARSARAGGDLFDIDGNAVVPWIHDITGGDRIRNAPRHNLIAKGKINGPSEYLHPRFPWLYPDRIRCRRVFQADASKVLRPRRRHSPVPPQTAIEGPGEILRRGECSAQDHRERAC